MVNILEDVEQLDDEWRLESEKYMVIGKYGARSIPTKKMSLMGPVLVGGMGIFGTIYAIAKRASLFFALFGVVFVLLTLGTTISGFIKAISYEKAERKYQQRRSELLLKPDS